METVPELTSVFPRGNRSFGLSRDKRSPHYAEEPTFVRSFGIPSFKDLDEVPWDEVLKEGLTVIFDHGVCQCTRRTYLFGQ